MKDLCYEKRDRLLLKLEIRPAESIISKIISLNSIAFRGIAY